MTFLPFYKSINIVQYDIVSDRNDYGVRSLESILDMVKVMSFALTNGKVCILFKLS